MLRLEWLYSSMDPSGNGRSFFVDFSLNPLTFHIYRSFADIYCCMTGQFSPEPLSVFEGLLGQKVIFYLCQCCALAMIFFLHILSESESTRPIWYPSYMFNQNAWAQGSVVPLAMFLVKTNRWQKLM